MANKFDGDVRPLSNDQRYMGVVFQGSMDEAIAQAHAAPDHGVAEQYVPRGMTAGRAALLEHLGVLQHYSPEEMRDREVALQLDEQRDAIAYAEADAVAPEEPSKYTVAYAIQKGFLKGPDVAQIDMSNQPHPVVLAERFDALTERQLDVYWAARLRNGVRQSLAIAEAYPYPAVQS